MLSDAKQQGKESPLRELALLFLKLGSTAFGGPAAHIAMMEDEVVRRRGWMERKRFLDLLGATNLIPGPNSTELAIHVGLERAGWPGLIVAGACFILPAMLIVLALAWAYVRYGALPDVSGLLRGIQPVIIVVVLQAIGRLGVAAVTSAELGALALLSAILSLCGVHELAILFGMAGVFSLIQSIRRRGEAAALPFLAGVALPSTAPAAAAGVGAVFGQASLFWFFLKVGSVLFGSGYVLLAFLRADLVERYHWLTEKQLLDAIAVGQFTPGPVFTTATFIGYLLGGVRGGLVATAGIFLPAFFFVAVSAPLLPRLQRSPTVASFLDALNAASLGLMAAVTVQLAASALVGPLSVGIALLGAGLLLRGGVNSTWLVLGGGLVGLLARAASLA